MASHFVIIKNDNGEPTQFPLKSWVRQHLNELPIGLDPDNQTSHDVRRQLSQNGWRLNISPNIVFVIRPDENNSSEYAMDYLGDIQNEDVTDSIESEEALEMTFGLERDLQAAIRKNIESLERGLVIIDNGKERNTEAGRIDITAKDTEGKTVIIELKAIDAKPEVVAQTLAYMESVKEIDKVQVRGIIVASGFPDRVKLAARQINNLKLVQYSFQFIYKTID